MLTSFGLPFVGVFRNSIASGSYG